MGTHFTSEMILAAVLFGVGLVMLFVLRRSNKRNVRASDNSGVIITGDQNRNISVQAAQPRTHVLPLPLWRKVVAVLAWLATLAGPVIAALAYWTPPGGG